MSPSVEDPHFTGTLRILQRPTEVNPAAWDALLAAQDKPTPFFTHAYLSAMHSSESAVPESGWQMLWFLLEGEGGELMAATQLNIKTHSYGEYVFDHAWANAYEQHGLSYYPKALVASPFTPVPSARLLAVDAQSRLALLKLLLGFCKQQGLSSLHLLFLGDADRAACEQAGLMLRSTVQFHWQNTGFVSYEAFLATLAQEKRKKILAERRKVRDAGVTWQAFEGAEITPQHWAFFYRCYAQTYAEHGNAPYLTPEFFEAMQRTQTAGWVMFLASQAGKMIASSLIALDVMESLTPGPKSTKKRAYGRYWGAEARVDCLHFDACYHQPLQWCIEHGIAVFEGGAQGQHKMARGLMPVQTHSAHWLAHPQFSDAVERFLSRESAGIAEYVNELHGHSPFRPIPSNPGKPSAPDMHLPS